MQAWLALPVVMLFASLFAFYLATAALLVWLSFRSKLSERIQSFKGLVAPFFVSTATIFSLLVGFLSNDIWERNKEASRVVLAESDTLLALYSLGAASGSDDSRPTHRDSRVCPRRSRRGMAPTRTPGKVCASRRGA